MKLLKSQTNQLFEIIQTFPNLSPNQFEIYNEKEYDGRFEIQFKNHKEYSFYLNEDSSYVKTKAFFCPGETTYKTYYRPKDWAEIIILFRNWLNNLIRELNEPDLWERFQSLASTINIGNNHQNNQKFTAKEYDELTFKINLLLGKINEQTDLNVENQKLISDKLNQITNLALDLNKFDWYNLFIGTIISIIIQLEVNKENANLIWSLIKETFNNLLLN